MRDLAPLPVGDEEAVAVAHGVVFAATPLAGAEGPGPFAVVDGSGALLAVYERRGTALRPSVVIAQPDAAK